MNSLSTKILSAIVVVASLCGSSVYGMDIFEASRTGNVARVSELIAARADVNVQDWSGMTPLHRAVFAGHQDIVSLLLNAGANPNLQNEEGDVPLYLAVSKDLKEISVLLLNKGANPNIQNKNGETPLYCAIFKGYKQVVKILLQHKACVNIKNNKGETPLHWATKKGYQDIVQELLEAGANVDTPDDCWRRTPLYLAAEDGHKEIIRLLLDAKANPMAKDWTGNTPSQIALERGHQEVVNLFTSKRVKDQTQSQLTALLGAAVHERLGSESPAQLLYDMQTNGLAHMVGAFVFEAAERDMLCERMLLAAARAGDIEKVKALLADGVHVNIQDAAGKTPLSWAICAELSSAAAQLELVKILLNAGANPNLPDARGYTPLDEATYRRLHTIEDLIIAKLAKDQAESQLTALLGAAVHERLGSESPAQLLYDMQTNGLAHMVGAFVFEAAKETALRR
jgi:ankyrin repeat protein